MANQIETTDNSKETLTQETRAVEAGAGGASVRHRRRALRAVLLACLLLAVMLTGGLFAKYVSQNRQEAKMISAGFHISSDYLKETLNQVNVAATGEIRIELYNWEVENTAQVAEMDILYKVGVTNGTLSRVTLNDTESRVNKDANDRYLLALGQESDGYRTKHILHITPETGADTVTVTVNNTSPYQKNGDLGLRAVFTRTVAAEPTYALTQHTAPDVWKLTIKTYGYSGQIKVHCGLAPDNTNDKMTGWTTGGTGTLTVSDNETYELLFFGTGASPVSETLIPNPSTVGVSVGN